MSQTNTAVEQSSALAEPPIPLIFTDSAAAKVADLIAEEGNTDLKLRVFVQGGVVLVSSMALLLMKRSMRTILPLKKMALLCWLTP